MPNKQPTLLFFLGLYLATLCYLGLFVARHESYALMSLYGGASVLYVFILQFQNNQKLLFGSGIGVRLLLFLSLPGLSDDLYRFIWDGTLSKNGIHPFENLPRYYLDKSISGIDQTLYERLNSAEYFTIYPPLNQFIFWLASTIGNGNWLVSAAVIRLFLFIADIGSFWFLQRLLSLYGKSKNLAFWYFLNPLVILEFIGNLHFEGMVICFLLGGIYGYEIGKKWLSATWLGLAVGTKLLPLVYLPYIFFKGLRERKWTIAILAGLIASATLLPLLNTHFISGMQSSLDLYFRKFEFNASIYFIAREMGYLVYGYNNIATIGPLLSVLSLISIIAISIIGVYKHWSIPKTMLYILTVYLAFTTTVHPWYILPLIALGVLSCHFYPVVWSLFIFITYLGYTEEGFFLPLSWVVVEYVAVALAIFFEKANKESINYN